MIVGLQVKWIDDETFEINHIHYDSLTDQIQLISEVYNSKNGQPSPIELNPASTQLF